MVETEEFGEGDTAAVCAPLELLPLETARGRRIHWLAGAAYLDLMRRFPDFRRVDLPLIMVGPEHSADHDVPRDFMITHLRELGDAAVVRPVDDDWWVAGGRGGWFSAAERALALLAAGERMVALGAVDTDCDPDSLLRLARRGALLGDDNPQGRIPGEAGVFVLLCRPEVPRQLNTVARAWIGGLRGGVEPRHVLQPRSTLGEGLTTLFAELRRTHPSFRADAVYSCQPTTNHWGRSFKLASLRNAALLPEPMAYHSLHDELGDCGSASAALQLSFATLRFMRGDELGRVLIYGESDDGTLGACLVQAPEGRSPS
jgi:3-oxoacyl-[acyl-carrier-protein] synthase-1